MREDSVAHDEKSMSNGDRCDMRLFSAWCSVVVTGCNAILGNDIGHLGEAFADHLSDASADVVSDRVAAAGIDSSPNDGPDVSNTPAPDAIGSVGSPCNTRYDLSCAGYAQQVVLICNSSSVWTELQGQYCIGKQVCDPRTGPNQGTCQDVVAGCEGKKPGDKFCSAMVPIATVPPKSLTCGPDLLTTTNETCPHLCVEGECSGVCDPGARQCSGNGVQTCQTDGTWGPASACPYNVCVGLGTCSAAAGCYGVPATCGPNQNGDCCAANRVTGGTYNRSNDASYPATVSDFRLDNYEVTVGRFRKFVVAYPGSLPVAGAGKNPSPSDQPDAGWNASWNALMPFDANMLASGLQTCDAKDHTWTNIAGDNENLPIDCLTWYEAYAFCIWDGGRLPTEAEWNYAAAGGDEQRAYPWSKPPSDETIDDTYAVYCGGPCSSPRSVGSRSPAGDGKWGQSDLAGNVLEAVVDLANAYSTSCDNCSNSTVGAERVLRGGSFNTVAQSVLTSFRSFHSPQGDRYLSMGARCARQP
jgi:formylglycine-generating enzyme